MQWTSHLISLPVILPLITGTLLIFINERRHELKLWLNAAGVVVTLLVGLLFVALIEQGHFPGDTGVYLSANWVAPFGIALVIDRFSALMLVLAGIIAAASLMFAYQRWSRVGVHFHSLFQYLLMGINGALITGDLFNLFVFFEVMLASSYGLLLHGQNVTRIRAGMQFIALNLVASFFFLIGIALIYAASGTLNMADLAGSIAMLNATDRALFEAGAAALAVAFLTKSAIWPLGFWLPVAYGAAAPPVAAMLVVVTKVGIYVIYRLWLIVFAVDAGSSTGFGDTLLFWGGLATMVFGTLGILGSQDARRVASYCAILSSGILLTLLGLNRPELAASAMFYLVSSTLAVAAFILLIELTERIYSPASRLLAITMEAFASDDRSGESSGVAIPGALAFLGLMYVGCALVLAGMPPLSGFIAKFGIVTTLLTVSGEAGPAPYGWLFVALLFVSGFCAIIALMRLGVRVFWASGQNPPPRLQLSEASPVLLLLTLCVALTVNAGSVRNYMDRTSLDLTSAQNYIEQVMGEPQVKLGSTPSEAER